MSKTPIEMMLDGLTWTACPLQEGTIVDLDMPYVTHEGVLNLDVVSLRVYQLSDGTRAIDLEDMEGFFGELLIPLPAKSTDGETTS